jgi:hypothetical protein
MTDQQGSSSAIRKPPRNTGEGSELPFRGMTKAVIHEGKVGRGLHWVTARRALLKVRRDGLQCRDWFIPYDEIEEAVLHSVWPGFIPGYVLVVRAGGKTYQFGLNRSRFWKEDLPFPVHRQKGKLGYSWYSIVIRIFLVAAWVYCAWLVLGRH